MPPKAFTDSPYALWLNKKQRARLASLIQASYDFNYQILRPFRTKIKLWRDLYDGGDSVRPTADEKPWSDSSEVLFPIPRLVADTAASRIVQSITQQRDVLWLGTRMQPKDYAAISSGGDLMDDLSAARRAFNTLAWDEKVIGIRTVADTISTEAAQIGTAIVRTAHNMTTAPKKRQVNLDGSVAIVENLPLKDTVEIRLIPPEVCVWDVTATDPADIPLLAYPFRRGFKQLQLDFAHGPGWYADALDPILISPDMAPSEEMADHQRRMHMSPNAGPTEMVLDAGGQQQRIPVGSLYTLHEVHIRNIDPNDDGVLEDITVFWHKPTNTIARTMLFQYIHNEPVYDFFWWRQQHGRPIGVGTIEPGETLAAGINAIANQTIDAQAIRNKPTLVALDTSDAADDLESGGWFPGQILRVRDIKDVQVLEFDSSNAVVSLSIFDKLIDIYFRINHLGPAQLGSVESAQRVAGDLGSSIMAEGLSLQDKVLGRFRSSLTSVCRKALAVLWQTNPSLYARILGADDFEKCKRLIDTLGWSGLSLDLNISSPAHSRELERQNMLAAMSNISQWQTSVVQGVMQGTTGGQGPDGIPTPPNPILQKVIALMIEASQKGMRQLLDSYPQITDPEELVPDVAAIIKAAMGEGGGAPPQPGLPGQFPGDQGGPGAGTVLPPR